MSILPLTIPFNTFLDGRNTGSTCHAPETALIQVSRTAEWPNPGAYSGLHLSGRIWQVDLLPFESS